MHDYVLAVDQPRGTSPQSSRQENADGEIVRNDSYSLTRGGKLVSSRAWSSNALVNMHAVEGQKKIGDRQHPRRVSRSSDISSSESESDSASGDSDDTSEDEYEVGRGSLTQGRSQCTVLQEESEALHHQGDSSDPVSPRERPDQEASVRQRSPGNGPLHSCHVRDVDESETVDCADYGEENFAKDGSDDEQEDDDDDSESEETESTVRAKPEGVTAYTVTDGKSAPVCEGDHNDTLSTLSGDLSFDEQDESPPREEEAASSLGCASGPRKQPSPVSISDPPVCTPGFGIASNEHVTTEEKDACAEGRVPPEGGRCTTQQEGVRAGIFCLSGYPRPGQRNTSSSNESFLSGHHSSSTLPHYTQPGELQPDCGAVDGKRHGAEHFPREMHARHSWGSPTPEYNPDGVSPQILQSVYQTHPSIPTGRSPQRDTWHPSSQKETPFSTSSDLTQHIKFSSANSCQNVENKTQDTQRETLHGGTNTAHNRVNSTEPEAYTLGSRYDSSQISIPYQRYLQHQQQSQAQLRSKARQDLQQLGYLEARCQPRHSQQEDSSRHAHLSPSPNSSQESVNRSSNSRREGVSASPAHPHPAAPASPMPRLLSSAVGLSGSASRLSGGAAGSSGGLSTTRLPASYATLGSSASSGYGSCVGVPVAPSSRHEDSEDLSDVSSGATSEDSSRRRRRRSAQSIKGEASISGNEDFEWVRASPMLTGLLEGQVTRLATPPDHRASSLRSSLTTPTKSLEDGSSGLTPRHRQYPRPPPVPRPRTLEAGELVPHRSVRDVLRDSLRDSRDSLRDRLYSPSRDLSGHRRSRDSSVERSGRDSSCERSSVSSLHKHNHHHHHHITSSRLNQHPCCDCSSCWCEEEELDYESCDERHHHHRHSYHEGLHRAHLHQLQPHHLHHHQHQTSREGSRERRTRVQGSAESGRSSPCYCRHYLQSGSRSSLDSHDYCASNRLALPCTNKVGGALVKPQGSRQHRRLDSDYIPLWSCHSPPGGSLEDRVIRLEGDKDSLQLQVTVLSEQVEAQSEKISDLENMLEDKKEQLQRAEEQLQKEVILRTSLETQRLELVSELSNMKLHEAAYERENSELREKIRQSDHHHHADHAKTQLAAPLTNSPSPSSISTLSTIPASSPNKSPAQPTTASPASSPVASHDAREFLPPRTPPPNARRKIDQFGTVPRQREAGVGGENNQTTANTGRTKGVMFGKGFHFIPFRVAGKRSTSAPNLAETEMQMIEDLPEGEYENQDGVTSPTSSSSSPRCNTLAGHRSPPTHPKTTGIKKIFTRLRRSSSGHLDGDIGEGDFRRGGMRATASARLGWTSPSSTFKEPSEAFGSWNVDTMEAWLGALGLSQYCSALRSWTSSGHHLSKATPQHLERELGLRHPLHRKKLQLAISARLSGDHMNTPLHRLDYSWVLRWLDDVGLPQYKDAFSEARIDGRVLNCLTYDDLSFLRLTNLLHVTSLKRGIQVLREYNFDPSVLKRRSMPDEDQRTRTAAQVALWTNHRVMEWLRTVDLSEYAPNLRGSGVHGALMVYEVRFTSELLASLLSIPCGKTLLRRHLNTHFKELVGRSVVQEKRELEAASGYIPLTTSAKVKMPKKSQFSLKRKKTKSDLEFDDLLCPLDEKPPFGALQDKENENLQDSSSPVIG